MEVCFQAERAGSKQDRLAMPPHTWLSHPPGQIFNGSNQFMRFDRFREMHLITGSYRSRPIFRVGKRAQGNGGRFPSVELREDF